MSDPREEKLEEAIYRLVRDGFREIVDELKAIHKELQPQRFTRSVVNLFSGDILMADNALVFNVGDVATDTLTPRLADGVTPSGGVVSGVAVQFSDPSATAVVNPDGTITFTGVAASASPVSGSSSCTVTDTDGVVSTWTVPFTVQTNAVAPPPPQQLTQSVANVFSTAAAPTPSLKRPVPNE